MCDGGFDFTRICTKPAHCPVCSSPNRCRLETGEAYKGPCWCEGPVLLSSSLQRLLVDLPEQRCLCPDCLHAIAANPDVTWDELAARNCPAAPPSPAATQEGDFYLEGDYVVFTAQYHLRRGSCCGSGCRHCPYTPRNT
ncbi:MAG TPA: cysteine-rich CWC family protein [Chthoniobacter sp.]|nr:cysteine-rich CWC family protein [Chthoniobacter sp.]